MRFLTAVTTAFLLTGCVTTQHMPQSAVLQENQGVMATKFSCESGLQWADVYTSGTPLPSYIKSHAAPFASGRSTALLCSSKSMKVVELPAGKYYIGKIGSAGGQLMFPEQSAVTFTVKPKAINYIGDIHVRTNQTFTATGIRVSVAPPEITDKSEQARVYLEKELPSLIERYDFNTELAKNK